MDDLEIDPVPDRVVRAPRQGLRVAPTARPPTPKHGRGLGRPIAIVFAVAASAAAVYFAGALHCVTGDRHLEGTPVGLVCKLEWGFDDQFIDADEVAAYSPDDYAEHRRAVAALFRAKILDDRDQEAIGAAFVAAFGWQCSGNQCFAMRAVCDFYRGKTSAATPPCQPVAGYCFRRRDRSLVCSETEFGCNSSRRSSSEIGGPDDPMTGCEITPGG